MRSLIVLAGLIASVTAGNLIHEDQCVVKGEYKKSQKEWTLTLGSCDDAVGLKFKKQGGYMKTTDDEFCLRPSSKDSKEEGSNIVLGSCNGRKWTLVDGWFWQSNYNNLCIAYDEDQDALVQVDCNDAGDFELDGCTVTPADDFNAAATTTVAPAAPTVTVTYTYTCGNYVASTGPNACPPSYSVPSNYYGLPCSGASCVSACCVMSQPSFRTCGSWAVQNGGPYNACGKYGELTPYLQQPCQSDRNCAYVCCNDQRPQEQTCAAWAAQNGGYYGNPCGMGSDLIDDLSTMCSFNGKNCHDICCTMGPLPPQSCADWNNCADGTQLKPNAGSLSCNDNECQATCCEEIPVVAQTCSSWNGVCPEGSDNISDSTECADDAACVAACCQETVLTCATYNCNNGTVIDGSIQCNIVCDDGQCCA